MGQHLLLNNFSGGEISPLLDARIDLAKYNSSCRTLENMRPLVHGGATFRSSTLYLAPTKFANKKARVIPFQFSTTLTYVIEMGDLYIRYYAGGSQVNVAPSSLTAPNWQAIAAYVPGQFVTDVGLTYLCILTRSATATHPAADPTHWHRQDAYEVISVYTEAEVFQVQFKEINNVVYMVHPNHPPQLLQNISAIFGDIFWTFSNIFWTYPPLTDENIDGTTTMAVGALSGNTTLTANAPVFAPANADSYFEVRHLRDANSLRLDLSASSGGPYASAAFEVMGEWTLTTTERWYGVLQLLRSADGGATWTVARQLQAASDQNFGISGTETIPTVGLPRIQLKLSYTPSGDPYGTPPWVGTVPTQYVKANAILQVSDAYIAGLVRCTGYTSTTVLQVHVEVTPASTAASTLWSQSEFDGVRRYPRTIGLYEQRLFLAGTAARPNTIWGSVAADFVNFRYSDLDDGAMAYQPAAAEQNVMQWMMGLIHLITGTAGEELMVGSGNTDEPLTPSNVTIRTPSSVGSESLGAILVGKAVLFLQRQGKRIREFIEGNPYLPSSWPDPEDITLFAEHITAPGVVQLDSIRLPDATVFAVITDGTLGVLTYNRDQNIKAWARYTTQGSFESVAAVYGSPADVVYTVVRRTDPLTGLDTRAVEVFTAEVADKQTGVFGMDSAVVITQASSTTVTLPDDHLNGYAVAVVADGIEIPGLTVVARTLTLPRPAVNIRVGLAYIGTIKPMKIDSMLANGTSQGRPRRVSELCLRFKDSLGCQYGHPGQPLYDLDFRSVDDPLDQMPPLFTGDKVLTFDGTNDLAGDIVIEQSQPFPMTVLGIFAKYEVMSQ